MRCLWNRRGSGVTAYGGEGVLGSRDFAGEAKSSGRGLETAQRA